MQAVSFARWQVLSVVTGAWRRSWRISNPSPVRRSRWRWRDKRRGHINLDGGGQSGGWHAVLSPVAEGDQPDRGKKAPGLNWRQRGVNATVFLAAQAAKDIAALTPPAILNESLHPGSIAKAT